jgi:signal transduction histidine kinase
LLTTDLAESLPPIYGDGNSIQRMVINLLDNAVDACDNGGGVKIFTREDVNLNSERQGVAIEFSDTGAGIAPEILPKVFDLFVTTKAPAKGTGLGLVICQEIVKAHGGTIDITSQVGAGTTVKVFLPAHPMPEVETVTEDADERPNIDR